MVEDEKRIRLFQFDLEKHMGKMISVGVFVIIALLIVYGKIFPDLSPIFSLRGFGIKLFGVRFAGEDLRIVFLIFGIGAILNVLLFSFEGIIGHTISMILHVIFIFFITSPFGTFYIEIVRDGVSTSMVIDLSAIMGIIVLYYLIDYIICIFNEVKIAQKNEGEFREPLSKKSKEIEVSADGNHEGEINGIIEKEETIEYSQEFFTHLKSSINSDGDSVAIVNGEIKKMNIDGIKGLEEQIFPRKIDKQRDLVRYSFRL